MNKFIGPMGPTGSIGIEGPPGVQGQIGIPCSKELRDRIYMMLEEIRPVRQEHKVYDWFENLRKRFFTNKE